MEVEEEELRSIIEAVPTSNDDDGVLDCAVPILLVCFLLEKSGI